MRFSNLRTQFQFTCKKQKIQMRSRMSCDEVYEPYWVHFKSLKFLTTGNPTQQGVSNMHNEHEVEVIENMSQIS